MPTPASANAGAVDQVPTPRAAVARAEIQRRECSEVFLKLSMVEFELKSGGRHEPQGQNMQAYPPGNPDPSMTSARRVLPSCSVGERERSPYRRLTASALDTTRARDR
jgi:hypothetical protein